MPQLQHHRLTISNPFWNYSMLHLQRIDVHFNRRCLPLLRFHLTRRHQLKCLLQSKVRLQLQLLCQFRLHRLLPSILTCRRLVVGMMASPLSLVIFPVVPLLLLLPGLIQHRLLTTLIKPICCFNNFSLPVLGPFPCLVFFQLIFMSNFLAGYSCPCYGPASCPIQHDICCVYHSVFSSFETLILS